MTVNQPIPRLVIAAIRGGTGKTTLSLGMIAAWRKIGRKVAPFKKGPDYIDAAWLSLAAEKLCHNLDSFLMGPQRIQLSFGQNAEPQGISLIEGNRGLYDGLDSRGTHSTAELAKILKAPVILIVDCNKMTRTAAAIVLGCQKLDPAVDLQGVILNQISRGRHEEILRMSIEQACHLPVLGAVPRMEEFPFPERHLGLTPPQEHSWISSALGKAAEVAEKYLNLDQLWKIGEKASPFEWEDGKQDSFPFPAGVQHPPIIGVVKDSAFQFYYPENLEALSKRGAKLVEISAVRGKELPMVDALYLGGGFPETHAKLLADNISFRHSLRQAIEDGLPVYAECGGLMYLGESLTVGTQNYPMVGALPLACGMERRPQGHGYTLLEVEKENPFFPVGSILKGHEFHYSRVLSLKAGAAYLSCRVKRGWGFDGKMDGLCYKNVLATYSHIHALGNEKWADAFVKQALRFQTSHAASSIPV